MFGAVNIPYKLNKNLVKYDEFGTSLKSCTYLLYKY